MRQSVVTPPAAEPLSLDEAKAHLRLTGTPEDTLVSSLITAAREVAEARTHRRFITATHKVELDGLPVADWRLHLSPAPVQSVSSIVYADSQGASQTWSTENYRLVAHDAGAFVEPVYGATWPGARCDTGACTVTFVAGYGSSGGDVPETARHAMRLLIEHWFDNRSATTEANLRDVPMAVETLLATIALPGRVGWS